MYYMCVGACIMIICWRIEFRSIGHMEVKEEIAVLIAFTVIGRSINLNLYM